MDKPAFESGTVSWYDAETQRGIITPTGEYVSLFFGPENVLIGTPVVGKSAQFTRMDTDPERPMATNIVLMEDAAQGAPINAQYKYERK